MQTTSSPITQAVGAGKSPPPPRGHTHAWLGEKLFPGGWHHIHDLTAGDEWWARVCGCGSKQEVFQKPPEARS